MNDNQHDVDLAGAYVLDALSPEEHQDFEAHLKGCVPCRREVAELRQVVDVLPLACDAAEPSPAVRDRIIAAIESEPNRPALTPLAGGLSQPAPKSRRFGMGPAFAVAAAVLIAVLGGYNIKLQRDIDSKKSTIALQQATLVFQQAVERARASGSQVWLMPKVPSTSGITVAMVQPVSGAKAYAVVKGFPATPSNRVYQFWFVYNARPQSAGVFRYQGIDPQVVILRSQIKGHPAVAVTSEPGPDGSQGPTTKPMVVAPLSA